MRRWWSILFLTVLCAASLRAQSTSPDNRYVMRVPAKYLGGFPYTPRTAKGEPIHVRGTLYAGYDSLHFRFCSENPDDIEDPMVKGVAVSVDNSLCENTCGPKVCRDVRIPYPHMKLLARGRVVGMGGTSEDIQVASAGLGIAGLIGGIATGGALQKGLIGATVGAAGVGFAIHEYELKRANFMSIFFTPADQTDPSLPCGLAHPPSAPSAQAPPPGPDGKTPKPADAPPAKPVNLFADANGCNVALFQIFNSHHYWNLSMILNSRTGKEFIAQNAETK